MDGFVIDLIRDDTLIEVQTSNFSSMKRKISTLLALGHQVRIVHPIPVDTWIVKIDTDGSVLGRRRSPKHGSPLDLFSELVSFPELFRDPKLEIDVILTHEDELRCHSPRGSWRRRGWSTLERRLIAVVGSVQVRDPSDLAALIPTDLAEPFTTADLATASGRSRRVAQQMAYCLRGVGVFEEVGKTGNSIEYVISAA